MLKDMLKQMAKEVQAAENADELTIRVAKIIDPVHFNCTPAMYGTDQEGFKRTMAYGHQLVALKRAFKIIELLGGRDA